MKKGKKGEKNQPDITNLRRDTNRLERERQRKTGGKGKRG